MTKQEAQTLAGDYFNDMAEGAPESVQAWGAFAAKIGAPSKPYFMLTMWPYFVLEESGVSFPVPYINPHGIDFYVGGSYSVVEPLHPGYLWSIDVSWLSSVPGGTLGIGFMTPANSAISGWGNQRTGEAYGCSQGDDPVAPQDGTVDIIVMVPGNFPTASGRRKITFTTI